MCCPIIALPAVQTKKTGKFLVSLFPLQFSGVHYIPELVSLPASLASLQISVALAACFFVHNEGAQQAQVVPEPWAILTHCCVSKYINDFMRFETVCLHPWVRVPAPPVLILVLAVTLATLAIVFWNSFHGIVAIVLWMVSIPFAIARLAVFARLAIFPRPFAIDLWFLQVLFASDPKLSVHRALSFD